MQRLHLLVLELTESLKKRGLEYAQCRRCGLPTESGVDQIECDVCVDSGPVEGAEVLEKSHIQFVGPWYSDRYAIPKGAKTVVFSAKDTAEFTVEFEK